MPADVEKAALEPIALDIALGADEASDDIALSAEDASEDCSRVLQAVLVDASLSLAVFVLVSALAGQQCLVESALCALDRSAAAPGFMAFRDVQSLTCSDVAPWVVSRPAHLVGFALVFIKLLFVRERGLPPS